MEPNLIGINEFHISCHGDDDFKWNKEKAIVDIKRMKKKIRFQ